jgi:hypothetical protein
VISTPILRLPYNAPLQDADRFGRSLCDSIAPANRRRAVSSFVGSIRTVMAIVPSSWMTFARDDLRKDFAVAVKPTRPCPVRCIDADIDDHGVTRDSLLNGQGEVLESLATDRGR